MRSSMSRSIVRPLSLSAIVPPLAARSRPLPPPQTCGVARPLPPPQHTRSFVSRPLPPPQASASRPLPPPQFRPLPPPQFSSALVSRPLPPPQCQFGFLRPLPPPQVAARMMSTSASTAAAPRSRAVVTPVPVTSVTTTMPVIIANEQSSDGEDASLPTDERVTFRRFTLEEIIQAKKTHPGDLVFFVTENQTVFEAIQLMEQARVGAVLVKSNSGQFTGIFTERDYLRKIALCGLSSRTTPVKQVMTSPAFTVDSSTPALEVMRLMTEKRFRHVPVRDETTGEIVGVISIGDIVANVMKEYRDSASFMRDFVEGRYPLGPTSNEAGLPPPFSNQH